MARTPDRLLQAVSDSYDASVASVDSAREGLLELDDRLAAAISELRGVMQTTLDDVRHGSPSARELRGGAETVERLFDQLSDAHSELRERLETVSGRGSLEALRALCVDMRSGEFGQRVGQTE